MRESKVAAAEPGAEKTQGPGAFAGIDTRQGGNGRPSEAEDTRLDDSLEFGIWLEDRGMRLAWCSTLIELRANVPPAFWTVSKESPSGSGNLAGPRGGSIPPFTADNARANPDTGWVQIALSRCFFV